MTKFSNLKNYKKYILPKGIPVNIAKQRLLKSYILGVLLSFPEKRFIVELTKLILNSTLEKEGLNNQHFDSIRSCLIQLTRQSKGTKEEDIILNICWDLLYHASAHVRKNIIKIFNSLIPYVDQKKLVSRIISGLSILSSDPDIHVTLLTIEAFGTVLKFVTNENHFDITIEKIEYFFQNSPNSNEKNNNETEKNNESVEDERKSVEGGNEDKKNNNIEIEQSEQKTLSKQEDKQKKKQIQEQHQILLKFLEELEKIIPLINHKLREIYVLPKLLKIAKNNQKNPKKKRNEISFKLLSVYRAFSGTPLSSNSITHHLMPGLNCLLVDIEEQIIDEKYHSIINTMIIEAKSQIKQQKNQKPSLNKKNSKFSYFSKRSEKN